MLQIYENLFKQETEERNERGELHFDKEGNVIDSKKDKKNVFDVIPTVSSALRPLLEFIDGYRRRVAAPEKTLIRTRYAKYADLAYI